VYGDGGGRDVQVGVRVEELKPKFKLITTNDNDNDTVDEGTSVQAPAPILTNVRSSLSRLGWSFTLPS
jgi:hypothetical protein